MSSAERDRRDLDSLAGMLFSGSKAEPPPGPLVDVLAVVSCGSPSAGPLLAVALSGLSAPGPHTVLLGVDGQRWTGLVDAPAAALAALEQDGGRALVLLPPRDVPEVRAVAFAAGRHVVWLGPGPAALAQLREFLRALELGGTRAPVALLTAHATDVSALAFDDGPLAPEHLGAWEPGDPLTPGLAAFVERSVPVPPGRLAWARQLLS